MPLTQQEKDRLDKILAASTDPDTPRGEGFSVDLRDFAIEQLDVNQQLRVRIKRLEEWALQDNAEVYVRLTVSGEDILV